MYHKVVVVIVVSFFANMHADSSEDQQGFTYALSYAPSTLNFHDIYANSLALLTDEPSSVTPMLKEDESFHLNNMHSQYVEFRPQTVTIAPSTTMSPPRPKYPPRSALIRNEVEEKTVPTTTTTTTTTTEEPEELTIKVLPIVRASKYQRGVLDLLFPASRVRNFKSVFDTVRRLLSHTF